MKEVDYNEQYEDYLATHEHCFDVEPDWNMELDIESMAL
jgi:hypothetical protein